MNEHFCVCTLYGWSSYAKKCVTFGVKMRRHCLKRRNALVGL